MKFSELDAKMRVYETTGDRCVLPGIYMVARLDGRHFHTLTKESGDFEAPFDEKFRDLMVNTTIHLMKESGFNFIYGYTESDEISLLFLFESEDFGRKTRKLNSVLAGEASAKFSLLVRLVGGETADEHSFVFRGIAVVAEDGDDGVFQCGEVA